MLEGNMIEFAYLADYLMIMCKEKIQLKVDKIISTVMK